MKNYEKFKTAEERVNAFHKWCNEQPRYYCDKTSCDTCKFAWLDLGAEEKKPLPCPFCGGEIYLAHDSYGQAYVGCKNCRYTYCNDEKTDDEIIAEHNRVAKAVMGADKKGDNE